MKSGLGRVADISLLQADFRGLLATTSRLHMYSTLTKEPIHKLEIYDAGEKTYLQMQQLVASIFDCDPGRLGLMRVDLCRRCARRRCRVVRASVRSSNPSRPSVSSAVVAPYSDHGERRPDSIRWQPKPSASTTNGRYLSYDGKRMFGTKPEAEAGADANSTLYGHS